MSDQGWWVISNECLMEALRRCANGEDPEWVYIEMYANCEEHERIEGES